MSDTEQDTRTPEQDQADKTAESEAALLFLLRHRRRGGSTHRSEWRSPGSEDEN